MALFRRKKATESAPPVPEQAVAGEDLAQEQPVGRGPWDSGVAPADGLQRLDLGALRVPGFPGMELRLEVDRAIDRVVAVTAVHGDAQLQMQAFAAPRNSGLWDAVRGEIVDGIRAAGGSVQVVEGPFGVELEAQVPSEPDGPLQPARFVGADGRRWFVRGVFSGSAVTPGEAATALEEVFAGTVVVRGDQAMAPRDLLPLQLPDQSGVVGERPSEWTSLNPLRRGPEITEIR